MDTRFIADLHIHSRFSMATSKKLTLPHLAGYAMLKGIDVLGCGDFTHPKWQAELKEHLRFDEDSGFYRLSGTPESVYGQEIPASKPPFFCLQTEISSIYKRDGKARRVHNLVFMPDLESVERFSKKLATIGNIASDGRPILGLDARDLLEIVLECSDQAVLIPAHIWTPWFSLFGSKSGFDRIEDCFGDLTQHIFALETGLSSDPAMNRLVSALDPYVLISNSDAHSGANLGREANLFYGKPSYTGMFAALRRAAARFEHQEDYDCSFAGTLEIYPEEGKYHLDGHRDCGVVLEPNVAQSMNNICPVCHKPLTIGVLHRVFDLADRKTVPTLAEERSVFPVIPLATILAELSNTKVQSKKTDAALETVSCNLGSEFAVLSLLPIDEIKAFHPVLAEAIQRIRQGQIQRQGGYDGVFGTIKIFDDQELKEIHSQDFLQSCGKHRQQRLVSAAPLKAKREKKSKKTLVPSLGNKDADEDVPPQGIRLDPWQQQACDHQGQALLVLAGPGSGKTRVLTERLAALLSCYAASDIVALTFSRKAAEEIRQRLVTRVQVKPLPFCGTLHAYCWQHYHKEHPQTRLLAEHEASNLLEQAILAFYPKATSKEQKRLRAQVELAREQGYELHLAPTIDPSIPLQAILSLYHKFKQEKQCVDFSDLLTWFALHAPQSTQKKQVLVDEIQDLSPLQVQVLARLVANDGQGFFGIGDPDQAIYAFRGSLAHIEQALRQLWPNLQTIALQQSYRSAQNILDAAWLLLQGAAASGKLTALPSHQAALHYFEAPNQYREERWLAEQIHKLLGATSHTVLSLSQQESPLHGSLTPSEIAVLVRVRAQIPALAAFLRNEGIPVQVPAAAMFWQDAQLQALFAFFKEQQALLPKDYETTHPDLLVPFLLEQEIITEEVVRSEAWQALRIAFTKHASWSTLLEDICWQQEVDLLQSKAESVRIMTMHAAKGLEFKAVFIPALNDGFLPFDQDTLLAANTEQESVPPTPVLHEQRPKAHTLINQTSLLSLTLPQNAAAYDTQQRKEQQRAEHLAEERRLFYVAITRASHALYLSSACEQRFYGQTLTLPLSPFFAPIKELFQKKRLVKRSRTRISQGGLL